MKTYKVLLAISTLLIVGCTVEQPEPTVDVGQKEITITAYRSDESETKTQRDESNGAVLWTPGDAISLFYGSGTDGGSKFTSNVSEPTAVTNFTGTIGVITGGADVSVEDTYFWGLYPYDPEAECDGSTVVTTLPSRQKAVPGTFDTGVFPSLGRAQGLSMGFYNICGGLRITVTRDDIKSVTLKAIGGEQIAGKARIGFDGGVPKVLEIMEGTDEITITAPAGKFLEPGKFYYFVAFPQTLSQGVQLTMESFSEMGVFERRPSANGMSVKRSVFGNLRNIDQGVEFTKKTGPIPIEDPAFKTYLLRNHDADGDGEISYEEAESVREVILYPSNEYNLQSLAGIEYMPNLEKIDCHGEWYDTGDKSTGIQREHYYVGPYRNSWDAAWGPIGTLKYVDVSNNPKLRELYLNNNSALGDELVTLYLSNNPDIEKLDISFTWLNYPDIALNTELREILFCHLRGTLPDFSRLSKAVRINLDFPQNADFEHVDFDVSGMPDLEILELRGMTRSLSDLSANKKLRYLSIAHCNNFTGPLKLSECPDLEVLQCMCSNLYSLDLSNNSKLKELYCNRNQLTELDLSGNPQLEWLECGSNRIASLDLSFNKSLKHLDCYSNDLNVLDVSNNDNLKWLQCYSNSLTSLDVSNCAELVLLGCWSNKISSLDVSHNTNLGHLSCAWNKLSSLSVYDNPNLDVIRCEGNPIQELCLDNNPKLKYLYCSSCSLSSLDLSLCPELHFLNCSNNYLAVLDVSHNLNLGKGEGESGLWCVQRRDSEGNNHLKTLFVSSNQAIPFVTRNRSTDHIPAQTSISYVNDPLPIEDPSFKAYLISNYDTNGNGQISYDEAKKITQLWMSPSNELNLQSLQGIEYMPNLEILFSIGEWYDNGDNVTPIDRPHYYVGPYGNGGPLGTIRKVDVRNNPKLRILNIAHNSALGVEQGTIDLSHNPLLEELCLSYTYLEYPAISHITGLKRVELGGLRGNMPDFSIFHELRHLNVEYPRDNKRSYNINVSNAPHLEYLAVSEAAQSISDLSLNPELKELHYPWCSGVGMVDLSKLPKLERLGVAGNGFTLIDISELKLLKVLHIDCNNLTLLDLSSNTNLEYVNCNLNQLSSLNLSGLPSLREIYCDGNPITELDVSHNTELRALGFSGTQITDIDVSNNKELTLIGCDNIPGLTHLDLRQNTKLQRLYINGDGFTSIDITKNTELWDFGCRGNKISALNVSNNRLLKKLTCVQQNRPDGKNYLQTLYVSEGQSIPHITIDRNADYIPAETTITTAPQSGGGEGTGEEEW